MALGADAHTQEHLDGGSCKAIADKSARTVTDSSARATNESYARASSAKPALASNSTEGSAQHRQLRAKSAPVAAPEKLGSCNYEQSATATATENGRQTNCQLSFLHDLSRALDELHRLVIFPKVENISKHTNNDDS